MLDIIKHIGWVGVVLSAGYALFYFLLSHSGRREVGFRPLIIFGGLAVVGFLSPNLYLLHALTFLTVPTIARRISQVGPAYLVALMAIPSLNLDLTLGSLKLVSYSVHETLALGAMAAYLLAKGRRGKQRIFADFPFIAIISLLLISSSRGTEYTNVLREALYYGLAFGIPYYVFTRSLRTVEEIRMSFVWLGAATTMLSVLLCYEWLASWPMYNLVLKQHDMLPSGMTVSLRLGSLRPVGPIGNASVAGFVLVFGMAAILCCQNALRFREGSLFLVGITCVALAMTQSRGSWLGAGIVILAITLYRIRGARLLGAWTATMAAGLAGSFAWIWGSARPELAGTVEYRQRLWQRGLEEFWKSPWVGDTFDHVRFLLRDMIQGEGIVDFVNAYLFFMLTTGALGALVFCLALTLPAASLWLHRPVFRATKHATDVGAMCFASLVASVAMLVFTSFQGRAAVVTLLILGIAGKILLDAKQPKLRRFIRIDREERVGVI